jgi:hypothetical protein
MAFLFQDQNQGTRNEKARAGLALASRPFSFIRTFTVGFGIAPNLLTLLFQARIAPGSKLKALAGLSLS